MLKCQFFIVLIFFSVNVPKIKGTPCGEDEGKISKAAIEMVTQTSTMIIGWTKFSPVTAPLYLFHGLINADGDSIGTLIDCHLREYHLDRLSSNLQHFQGAFNKWKSDKEKLKDLLNQVEQLDVISSFQSRKDRVKAAIFPVLAPWSALHIALYKQLISTTNDTERIAELETMSDAWLLFYSRLLLNYARPHRISAVKNTRYSIWWLPFFTDVTSIQSSPIMKSGAELIKNWSTLAYNQTTSILIDQYRESCRLRPGTLVQFRRVGECFGTKQTCYKEGKMCRRKCDKVRWYLDDLEWLVCSDTHHLCRFHLCNKITVGPEPSSPARNSTWTYQSTAWNATWTCPLAKYKVHTNEGFNISMFTAVQLEHRDLERANVTNNSFWLRIKDSSIPVPAWVIGMVGVSNIKPKECVKRTEDNYSTWYCKNTDLRLMKWDVVDENIYDGSFILLGDHSAQIYEMYIEGSECGNSAWIQPPAI